MSSSSTLETRKQTLLQFSGPMSAVATPFTKQGALDVSQIEPYARVLAHIGVTGVYILGTTGEGYSLTLEEKITLVKAWRDALDAVAAVGKRLTAIVNVSSTVVSESIELAKTVEQLGFDGVALLPPIYNRVNSAKGLIAYLNTILRNGAPNTAFLYYHIPSFTGELPFELDTFVRLALDHIPQFVAMKFTDNNIIRYQVLQEQFGSGNASNRVNIFAGFEETLLTTRVAGGKAEIGATLSLPSILREYHSLLQSLKQGDLAQARTHQQVISHKCVDLRVGGNFFLSLKQTLNDELKQYQVDGKNFSLYFGLPRSPIYNNEKEQ